MNIKYYVYNGSNNDKYFFLNSATAIACVFDVKTPIIGQFCGSGWF